MIKYKIDILKIGDIIIIFTIIAISVFIIELTKKDLNNNLKNNIIVVKQDKNIIGKYDLNYSSNSKLIDFYFYFEGKKYKGTLETLKGKVRLKRLPKEIVKKGIHSDINFIEDNKKIIIALPVKLIVYIENNKDSGNLVDSISG